MNQDIRDLIYQTIDKTISAEDFDRLQDAMLEDVEIQKEYLRTVSVLGALAETHVPDEHTGDVHAVAGLDHLEPSRSGVDSRQPPHGKEPSSTQALRNDRVSRLHAMRRTFTKAALVVAATLLVTLTLQSYTRGPEQTAVVLPTQSVASQQQTPFRRGLARIVQRIDCVIDTEKWGLRTPEEFHAGESIAISKGLLSVEFNNGVVVTLEGPADLEIQTGESCYLHFGRLLAITPVSDSDLDRTHFEIVTPSAQVVTPGNQFGVDVDSSGNTEVHCFAGQTELIPTRLIAYLKQNSASTPSTSERLVLEENSAVRLLCRGSVRDVNMKESIPAVPRRFVGIPRDSARILSPQSITNLPSTENLSLWFEASQGVQRDERSRVVSWDNLADGIRTDGVSARPSRTAAWQVAPESRPLWRENSFPLLSKPTGWPTLQFDGRKRKECLVTSPIECSDDLTVFVVCSLERDKVGAMLSLQSQTKIRLSQSGTEPKVNVSAMTTRSSQQWTYQRHTVKGESQLDQVLVLAGVKYSFAKNTYELYVDGRIQGSGIPLQGASQKRSHVIGANGSQAKSFLAGNIAEIVVYDRMLDDDDFNAATEALLTKYHLSLR
ncbi:FecR protein [Rhodopirellula sallentina]|uniref:FecR protein domain protein n=1 Tax=Rhodopirellula sallentina SM41 TaxID=1263870 RepID=M5U4Q0_9BACT|nr:FecR protein [Rhodopirellula sallentina]EMI56437.1 FecR protein domain protein [Rhodopirellula sallentina SM41]